MTTHAQAVEAARGVAAVLAKDALERDRANAEPLAEAQLLRDAGLPALLLPTSVGGAGLGWTTALRVVREIAVADGSIAQLLGYHYVNVANLWWVGGIERWGPPSAAGHARYADHRRYLRRRCAQVRSHCLRYRLLRGAGRRRPLLGGAILS